MLLSYSHIAPEAESVVELKKPDTPQNTFPQNQGVVCEAVIMVDGRTHSLSSTVIIKSFEDFLTDTACGNKTETAPFEDVTVAFVRLLAVVIMLSVCVVPLETVAQPDKIKTAAVVKKNLVKSLRTIIEDTFLFARR